VTGIEKRIENELQDIDKNILFLMYIEREVIKFRIEVVRQKDTF
jgi:hypothetical protein